MATFQFLTGELVTVEADTLAEAWELIAEGEYTFGETYTEHRPTDSPCPNHEGAYDCTPFCGICAGEQECKPCPNPEFQNLHPNRCGQCKGWNLIPNR